MKRLLLLSAVLLGAVTASQAGVRLSIGVGIPLPGVIYSQPAPVFVAPPVCTPPPAVVPPPVVVVPPAVIVAPPVVPPAVVVAPGPAYYGYRRGWYDRHGWGHRDWDHHGRGGRR